MLALFDGLGALVLGVSRLPVQVVGFASSEIDKQARRLVRKRWPGVVELGNIKALTSVCLSSCGARLVQPWTL